MIRQAQMDTVLLRKVAGAALVVLVVVYAIAVISRPSINPEFGMGYLMLDKVKTLQQALDKFVSFNEPWYRPFTFYFADFLLFQLIDIHNIYLIKIVAVFYILLGAFVATELSKKIFEAGILERALVFALIVTHPLYYAVAIDGDGIVDPIFNAFLNLFLICFLTLLESAENKIASVPATISVADRRGLAILCCIFLSCAITSHERGLAVFAMIGVLCIYYHFDQLNRRSLKLDKAITAVVVFGISAFLLYMVYVFGGKQRWSGEDYRTVFEPQYVLSNLCKAVSFPFRLDFQDIGKGYDVHHQRAFNLLALPFFLALVAYVIAVCRGNDSKEKSRLIITALCLLCALPIPIWFGGNSWHFFTAGLYASLLTGRAVTYWIASFGRSTYFAPSLLAVIFLWLIGSTVRGLNQEQPPTNTGPLFMLNEALHDETLLKTPFMPEVVYYDTGSWGAFTWPFGGQGNLFKFLYSNPTIVEVALVKGKVLETDKPLCQLVTGKQALYFGFDVEHFSWHTIPEKNYCAL